LLKRIDHLIRYFAAIGLLTFFAYIKSWNDDFFLIFLGPCLYLAHGLKSVLSSVLGSLPSSRTFNHYGLLLPISLVYSCLIGFQMKQLWNERGKARFISLFALVLFLIYIHYLAWKNLSEYMA